MDYLGENRYQLLFIDDDDTDDSDEQSIGQPTAVGPQSKNKRNKNKNVITAGSNQKLNEKPSQQQQQQQQLVEQQQETPQQQQQTPPPRSSPDKDKLQQQQQQLQLQQQQSQPPPFRYRQRIINNSNRFNAAGYGGGGGVGGGVGGGGYRGNSARNMKTNDSNNHEQQQQLPDEGNSKCITMEQWNAMRGERAKPTYNIRQPGEGEPSKPHWQQMVKLQQKKSPLPPSVAKSDEDNNNGIDCDASMYPHRVGRLQRVVDIEFKFKDDRRRNAAYRSGWMLARPFNTQARIQTQTQTKTQTQSQSQLQLESNPNRNNNNNNNSNSFNNYEAETALDAINMNDEAEFPTLG